ncbi:hypothetical protein SKAU_G00018120 [Synaphobranchus kaupii]|uniref:Uncharacterized protein n=1 Tax=Synaphobranchus kaupii TaxID=118154 RepID=A0A9Q1GBD4_SYNKA|nr:hypothetical protein SKAU_G00018120 [Synaphobranchus kaupii]
MSRHVSFIYPERPSPARASLAGSCERRLKLPYVAAPASIINHPRLGPGARRRCLVGMPRQRFFCSREEAGKQAGVTLLADLAHLFVFALRAHYEPKCTSPPSTPPIRRYMAVFLWRNDRAGSRVKAQWRLHAEHQPAQVATPSADNKPRL